MKERRTVKERSHVIREDYSVPDFPDYVRRRGGEGRAMRTQVELLLRLSDEDFEALDSERAGDMIGKSSYQGATVLRIARARRVKNGFTLAEILIAVAIIALVLVAIIVNFRQQISRSYDSLRKKHLREIQRAFEEYMNDNGCYPDQTTLANCGGPDLSPYLKEIPCDPQTGAPYTYYLYNTDDVCTGYRVFTYLMDVYDSDIARIGCNGVTGCGFGASLNYGISAGVPVADPAFDPGAEAPPAAPPAGGGDYHYACSSGSCNNVSDPSRYFPVWSYPERCDLPGDGCCKDCCKNQCQQ